MPPSNSEHQKQIVSQISTSTQNGPRNTPIAYAKKLVASQTDSNCQDCLQRVPGQFQSKEKLNESEDEDEVLESQVQEDSLNAEENPKKIVKPKVESTHQ